MPRRKKHEAHLTFAIGHLLGAVASLVKTVGGAVASSPEVRGSARKVGTTAGVVGHAASERGAKLANAIKVSWAKYTPSQRKARIAKMHAWRKVKVKVKGK